MTDWGRRNVRPRTKAAAKLIFPAGPSVAKGQRKISPVNADPVPIGNAPIMPRRFPPMPGIFTVLSAVRVAGPPLAAFADASFDLVISVGAPTYFGLTLFVTEAARVVTPGGIISLSGGYR